jgi:hypothetical protein
VSTPHINVPEEEIARRAYELWQSRGCPPGDGGQDWDIAKQQLLAERGGGVWQWWSRVRNKISRRAAAM